MNKKFIIYNSGFQYATIFFNLFIGVFLFPFYVESIGLENYGVWVSSLSIISLLLLFDPGFTFLVPQNISKYRVENKKHNINIFITESVLIALILCFILILLFSLIILILSLISINSLTLIFLKENHLLISVYILSQLFFVLLNSISLGLQIVKFTGLISIISNFIYIFSIIYFLKTDYGNISFLYALIIKNIIFIIFHLFYYYFKIKLVALKYLKFKEYRSNFVNQNLSTLGAEIPRSMPSLIVGYYNPSLLAVIKIFQSIPDFTRSLIEKPFYIMISPLTELLKKNPNNSVFTKIPALFVMMFCAFCLFFIMFNQSILILWIGQKVELHINVQLSIILYIGISFCSKILVYILYSEGKFNQMNKSIYLIGALSFLFSFILNFKNFIFIYYLLLFFSEVYLIRSAFKHSSVLFTNFHVLKSKLFLSILLFIISIFIYLFFNVEIFNLYFKIFFYILFVLMLYYIYTTINTRKYQKN